jgi:hypothetical protein
MHHIDETTLLRINQQTHDFLIDTRQGVIRFKYLPNNDGQKNIPLVYYVFVDDDRLFVYMQLLTSDSDLHNNI